ncbi:helix-turn-helix domain-containing protein [Haloactinomyces albus]|uniref:Transcriptional regulator with XRE-family HTH domain n=1 Tax=Haloactinomyces albus TaxID=1352928 RepID=A0AAE3ZFA3_9ACTN|nr:helix-turn-helix transcriptional regulator [Haloactinomyces albus]MDR7302791.1 transcriptional regulator with XRE-family HTH domain [Haloactinomyces albus]
MATVGSPDSADGGQADAHSGGPTARRIVLGAQLRRLREAAEISRADAGYSIRASGSKISRIELGRVSFKERDVSDLLTMYGVTDAGEREGFLDMVKRSNEPGWWHRYTDLMPEWFQDYVGLEESVSRIQTYELQFVPGLMQTEDYARAVAGHGRPELAGEDVQRRVALRMHRQKLLARPGAPRLWAVIDESVLHRPIGGRQVMRAQIEQLLEITKLPHVTLQVVPYRLSGYAAEGAFSLLRFTESELPDLVYIEHLSGALYLEKPEEIELYSRVLDRLAVDAETPEQTRQLLTKMRAEF